MNIYNEEISILWNGQMFKTVTRQRKDIQED